MKPLKLKDLLSRFAPTFFILALLALWQLVTMIGIIPAFMLPSPIMVVKAIVSDFPLLLSNAFYTLSEAVLGLILAVIVGLVLALVMDIIPIVRRMLSPVLLLTQTIPAIALAPLLILWLGYGIAPKIALVFLTCFFPITMGMLTGFSQIDKDSVNLLFSMGGTTWDIYRHLKLPSALPQFFSSLKVSATYAFVGGVVAEWLGGDKGLGVYMTRVRKSYSMDKMFGVIFFISFLSVLFVKFLERTEKKSIPWAFPKDER